MSLTFLHILIISATVFAVIGSGFYVSRSVRSSAGYSVAGRSAGASLVAGSIAGTVVGGGATVGTAQLAYSFGLSAWWFTLGSGIAFILMGIFYAKRLRNTALETIPQYLELYYGKKAETLSSIISSIGILLSAVASSLPGIEIISALFGLTPFLSALLLMALVIAYTFFGGMKSAAVSGILKMVIIWISLFISGAIAFLLLQENNTLSSFPASHFDLMGQGTDSAMAHLFSVIIWRTLHTDLYPMHLLRRHPFESGFRLLHRSTYRHPHRAAVSSCRHVHARRRARNLTDLGPAHFSGQSCAGPHRRPCHERHHSFPTGKYRGTVTGYRHYDFP